jgi:predicted RNase H-like nuclease (RuvC/YqgF family)
MKTIQNVLREKEAEIEKLTREIKMLKVAARIMEDEGQGQSIHAAESLQRHVEVAGVHLEEPMLDVLPVAGSSNGESSKRWP